jgi:hypothetical protein
MVTERAAHNGQAQVEQIQDSVSQAVQDGRRIDSVERDLMRFLLSLGHSPRTSYVARQGNGDLRPEVTTPRGPRGRAGIDARLPELRASSSNRPR